MTAQVTGPVERAFAQFIALEQQARVAVDTDSLAYALVNDGQALFGYRHAALLIAGRVRAVTGISVVEPHAPFVAFVENAARQLLVQNRSDKAHAVDPAILGEQTLADWRDLSAASAFWLPLLDRRQQPFGGLWIARDQPWSQAEQALLAQLGNAYGHAWLALQPRKPWRLRWPKKKVAAVLAAALLLLLVPVRQSVLAPAEVIPLDGRIVAAPLDGVIAEFLVAPNQTVARGDVLLRFEATSFKAQADVAERALDVAEAELKANAQRAFSDADASARIDLFAARVEQKRVERDYARELLARSEVRAERDGIAVFADAQRWLGRPVQTGERLMEIADPSQAKLRIELPVGDAIALDQGAEVALFLDSDPLNRHSATLEHSAYEAQVNAAGQLTYRLDAGFVDQAPRIGLRGTAKVFGQSAPLALYLLRRPLAALRQSIGF
ncbi:HlyD family efflux transporter periplasmic adaptor subunit [Ectopseudomonas mendocina]|uniref:HlyD family efflux transporter periplasmic adaptor subunit n=1 Tax=Ectopseudomonas mendocina TaxID=300 RepID=A0ABD7RYM0_ECTME|nr:HlyD family efflux transporter periplasmic adaptor subunit [Pseudomonas mendocina]TRO14975.1 HlyD family efflux transporter periplasmic adaptor subunit [Pseudomonas mendocina]TRO18364.1 HlyD family efflux transporter periplasmic adaptor subunit [Pseudomonas mendocina]